jgi:hypothetical protein
MNFDIDITPNTSDLNISLDTSNIDFSIDVYTGIIKGEKGDPGGLINQVQSDWEEVDDSQVDFIKNKPDLVAENISYENITYTNVKLALDYLLYTPLTVSYTGGSINEIGSVITVNLNWLYNNSIISQSINGNVLDSSIRLFNQSNISTNTNYNLIATDGTRSVNTTQSTLFKLKNFWGTGSIPTNTNSVSNRILVINSNPSFQDINTGSFQIQTGSTDTTFWVLIPPGLSLVSCLDTTANATIDFTNNGSYVIKDAGSVDRMYTLYSVTLGQHYLTSHNWTINVTTI